MHLKFRNVNTAFRGIVQGIYTGEIPTEKSISRNGPVLVIPEPVIISYSHPRERVLFNRTRDVNPFSLMYESLWMLAGRNDVAPLAYYTKQFQQYSDDGETLSGAYGYRWRNGMGWSNIMYTKCIDQLQIIIDHLRAKPESRRAILNMWNVEDDLLKMDTSKDVCCNLNVLFSIRVNDLGLGHREEFLDMTVFNRSNDLIWGALGANFVTFSFLQEYAANCLGVEVGVYNQISNNLHVYTESNSGWKPEEWLADDYRFSYVLMREIPLVQNQKVFDEECVEFVEEAHSGKPLTLFWKEPFMMGVAAPMAMAFKQYKKGDFPEALTIAGEIVAHDWRIACVDWLLKRQEKRNAKADS